VGIMRGGVYGIPGGVNPGPPMFGLLGSGLGRPGANTRGWLNGTPGGRVTDPGVDGVPGGVNPGP